jgi:hypothetical protein
MRARLATLAVLSLAACGDYSAPDSVVFGKIVATQHDPNANWNDYQTYSINPAVAVVDGTGTILTSCTVDGSQLVPTIRARMDERGYTEVPWVPAGGGDSDLEITINARLGSQDVYYTDWCGWYGYYYCYPGWTYAGSYNFGTVVVDIGDALHLDGTTLPLIWRDANYGVLASYYNGCTGGGNNVNWAQIQAAINRAFDQSPYIQRTAQ